MKSNTKNGTAEDALDRHARLSPRKMAEIRERFDRRQQDVLCTRNGVHLWWFQVRDMLMKITASADLMASEAKDNPDGVLAAVIDGDQMQKLAEDVQCSIDMLNVLAIDGPAHVYAPTGASSGVREGAN